MLQKKIKGIRIRLTRISKSFYQNLFLKKSKNIKIAFIIGCQRSGTTMLSKIFQKDLRISNYPEKSVLSNKHPKKLRLNPLTEVLEILQKGNTSLIAMKPLVESQNIVKLIDFFENSKAIWVFRNFKDVASSDLKKFGKKNGINNLRPIFTSEPNNWRSENVSEKTKQIIKKYFSENMSNEDAAALFWYCRNIIFFEQNLQFNKKVRLCKYEDLVTDPKNVMKRIYSFLDFKEPFSKVISGIHPSSISKGKDLELSPEIHELCEALYEKINSIYENN